MGEEHIPYSIETWEIPQLSFWDSWFNHPTFWDDPLLGIQGMYISFVCG